MARAAGQGGHWHLALRWAARVAVLAVLLPVAALSIANLVETVGSSRLELLRYLPYPVFLAPAVGAFILSFVLRPVWRWAAAGAVLLVGTAIMGLVIGHADSGSGRLRVMSYNVKAYLAEKHAGGFESLEREVAAQAPDILVMQDAGELSLQRSFAPSIAASIFEGREVYQQGGQYIVVSRYPLHACALGDLSYRRVVAHYVGCTVTVDGVEIDLVTAHLLSPRRGLNATRREAAEGLPDWRQNFIDRLSQADKLAALAAQRPRPLILAGDLNAPEPSPVIRLLLAQGLRDAFSSAGLGYGYTLGHALRLGISFLRIDHILVSPELGVADCFVGGPQASEHRPVIADLLLHRDAH